MCRFASVRSDYGSEIRQEVSRYDELASRSCSGQCISALLLLEAACFVLSDSVTRGKRQQGKHSRLLAARESEVSKSDLVKASR
jgi:hypothetical protein